MGIQKGPGEGREQVSEIATRIAELVTKMPERVFVQTREDGILEVIATLGTAYFGNKSYKGEGGQYITPPSVDSSDISVETVDDACRLTIKWVPAHTEAVYSPATKHYPEGVYPKQVARSLDVADGEGKSLLAVRGEECTTDLNPKDLLNIVDFLNMAIAQGAADKARAEAKVSGMRNDTHEELERLL